MFPSLRVDYRNGRPNLVAYDPDNPPQPQRVELKVTITDIVADPDLARAVQPRLDEAHTCQENGAYTSAVIMLGSLLRHEMGAQVVPDQDDGAFELVVRPHDEVAVVLPGESLGFALAAPVDAEAVDQPGAVSGAEADHSRYRNTSGTHAPDVHDRSPADPAPGPRAWRPQRLAGLVLADDPGPAGRRRTFTCGHTSFLHNSTTSSSRSIALRAGCCQDQPCRFSSRHVPSIV